MIPKDILDLAENLGVSLDELYIVAHPSLREMTDQAAASINFPLDHVFYRDAMLAEVIAGLTWPPSDEFPNDLPPITRKMYTGSYA